MHERQQTRMVHRLLLAAMSICSGTSSLFPQAIPPTSQHPRLTVALTTYGFSPEKGVSNRIFFRDLSVGKLMAFDPGLKLVFISEDVLVAYSVLQKGADWRTASRELQAYFIRTSDGTLWAKKTWPSTIRKDESDADTEGRIIPLRDGRFLVDANGTLMLYGRDLSLIREKKLAPFGPTEMWSVQSVSEGREIFLRHETSLCPDRDRCAVQYEWRDAESFEPLNSAVGDVFQGRRVRAAGDGVYIAWSSNTNSVFEPNTVPRKLCDDWRCSQMSVNTFLAQGRVVLWSSTEGVGVADLRRGLLWFQAPSVGEVRNFSFGQVETSLTENRFAMWASTSKKSVFDSVIVRSSVLFIFDTNNPNHVFAIPEPPGSGLFALSPSGSELATVDGKSQLHFYNVP